MRPRRASHPWWMLGPSLALWALVLGVPLVLTLKNSLYAWDMLTEPEWVGVANYKYIAEGGELWGVFWRTLAFSSLVVAGAMTAGLSLAMLLHRPGRMFAWVRGAVFSAYVVSWVSVALVWVLLLDPDTGPVGRVLRLLGLGRFGFFTDPSWALPTLALVTSWKITGYAMVVFLSGLQAVPPALLQAALLDGAGRWAQFRFIVWPLLRPTAAFVATTSLIVSFQAFDVVRIMTGGGPARSTTLFVFAIYEQIALNLSVGKASAYAVVYFVALLGLSALQAWAWSSRERSLRKRQVG